MRHFNYSTTVAQSTLHACIGLQGGMAAWVPRVFPSSELDFLHRSAPDINKDKGKQIMGSDLSN